MGWQRRFRDLAIAGGLAACATHGLGASCAGDPACDENPDPCCVCYQGDTGGYGGAGCVDQSGGATVATDGGVVALTCANELACAAKPTAACCALYDQYQAGYAACADAGFGNGQAGSAGGGEGL
jgi:hypothetical protein